MPFSTQFFRRDVARCSTASDRPPKVLRCYEAMKLMRDGAQESSSAVVFDVSVRLSAVGSSGGVGGVG